ncbi:MAG TPA: adenylate/guanylate cyclase domain-containing protein [Roseiarcus sp.]|nr:adenylate/guanylate cyclase domain-containing protein [Roseiarcus sp.]
MRSDDQASRGAFSDRDGVQSAVRQWLEGLGLGQYASAFAENDIDFAVLHQLIDADLKELGVVSIGHRKRLLSAIAARAEAPRPETAPAGPPSEGERRQVTVLFADLSGFTTLSQTLDPEQVRELVGRFTALVDGVIVSYGGTVDKHIGDAVMALFGAPKAHDDDPLRAARAALDIHEALGQWSETAGRLLRAHIGIANGEVVAGAIDRAGARDYTVLGESVNLAARLVGKAEAGQTVLSEGVYRALAGRAACEALGEIQLKGVDAPVRAWRLGAISGDPPTAARSAFVGRQAELQQFRSIVAACLARNAGHAVYVRGEAGIGKTRLVDQMRSFAESQGFVAHRSLVLDFGVGKGQDPIRALLQSLLGLSAASEPAARSSAAERVERDGVVTEQQLVFLHDLLDLPQVGEWRRLYDAMDNAARNRGKRAVATAVVAEACRRAPTLIVVEDLHWADPQTLAHLAAFASAMAAGPGLLAMTSRVEGDPLDAAWRASCGGAPFATIDLGPLRPDEALSLAGGFIDTSQRVARACIERAGGNPLFLEQLLRNAEEGSGEAIPASIQSLVLARMDRLSQRDRLAFQTAAVIGQRFDLTLLRRLIGLPDYACDGLIGNALVLPEGDDFLFAHALIQEGAYSSLLRSRRRELHRQAAEWFADRDLALRAQHLDRAEDVEASGAYLEAAQAQRAAYRSDTALRSVERGLEIARRDADRYALMCLKGDLQRDLGDIAASIATYRLAFAASPDDMALCRAQLGLAEGLRFNEGLDEALALLKSAQQTAERRDAAAELARLHHLRGNIYFPIGNIDGCREEHERSLDWARRAGSPEAEARSLGGLADAAYAQGRMRTAFDHFSRCVALSREYGFGRIEVANWPMVGFSRMYLNEAKEAREDGDASARAAAMVGQPRAEMLSEILRVFACCEVGDYDGMTGCLDRSLRLARQLGARRFEAQGLEMQGRMLLAKDRRKEAAEVLREGLAICDKFGAQFCGPKLVSVLSRVVVDPSECAALLVEGAEMLKRGAVSHNHLWFHRDAIEALLAVGDAEGALRHVRALEEYTRAEPLPWSDLFAARGRALAASLARDGGSGWRDDLTRVRSALTSAGFRPFLPAVETALAA